MATSEDGHNPIVWLARKQFDETSLQFRNVWDIYMKFYTVFLTFNGAALGLTIQYVKSTDGRLIIVGTFLFQNILAGITAVIISFYSRDTERRSRELAPLMAPGATTEAAAAWPPVLRASACPGQLAQWGALANALGHVLLIVCWLAVLLISAP